MENEVTLSEIMEYVGHVEEKMKQKKGSCNIRFYGDGNWLIFSFMSRALMSGTRVELITRIKTLKQEGKNDNRT